MEGLLKVDSLLRVVHHRAQRIQKLESGSSEARRAGTVDAGAGQVDEAPDASASVQVTRGRGGVRVAAEVQLLKALRLRTRLFYSTSTYLQGLSEISK